VKPGSEQQALTVHAGRNRVGDVQRARPEGRARAVGLRVTGSVPARPQSSSPTESARTPLGPPARAPQAKAIAALGGFLPGGLGGQPLAEALPTRVPPARGTAGARDRDSAGRPRQARQHRYSKAPPW
jgi:hypothetical protein